MSTRRRHSFRLAAAVIALLLAAPVPGTVAGSAQLAALVDPQEALHYLQNTPQDVFDYIRSTLVASGQTRELLIAALTDAFAKGRTAPDRALLVLQLVNGSAAPQTDREGVLLTYALTPLPDRARCVADFLTSLSTSALPFVRCGQDLPVEMLENKILEGLSPARGVPMVLVLFEAQERAATLAEVRDLLAGKGLQPGVQLAGVGQLSLQMVDLAITAVAGALEDYVRGGGKPADGAAVRLYVLGRLQQDPRFPSALTSHIGQAISEAEWARLATSLAARLQAQPQA